MPQFDLSSYIDVQERINQFWTDHPEGAIRTTLMSDPNDFSQCRYKAEVHKKAHALAGPDATGYAFEVAGGGGANRTSHEENCETSAIGRALANMGYATSREDRPSRQEMAKVNRAIAYVDPTPRSNRASIDAATQQSTLTDVEPAVTSWGSLWTAIRAAPYHLMTADDFTELVQRAPDQFKSPQHAFNAVKKEIRERDAAIDADRTRDGAAN